MIQLTIRDGGGHRPNDDTNDGWWKMREATTRINRTNTHTVLRLTAVAWQRITPVSRTTITPTTGMSAIFYGVYVLLYVSKDDGTGNGVWFFSINNHNIHIPHPKSEASEWKPKNVTDFSEYRYECRARAIWRHKRLPSFRSKSGHKPQTTKNNNDGRFLFFGGEDHTKEKPDYRYLIRIFIICSYCHREVCWRHIQHTSCTILAHRFVPQTLYISER